MMINFKKIFKYFKFPTFSSMTGFIFFLILLEFSQEIQWLALGKDKIQWHGRNKAAQCKLARRNYGLLRQQVKICKSTFEAMPVVAKAAEQTFETCQQLFEKRRWNCSSILTAPNFTPDLTTGTREQAFVYALSSASVAYAMSKACASGGLFNCSCSAHPKEPPNGNFKWGGCGDNIRWGIKFGKHAIEASLKTQCKCHGVSGSCSIKICWRALPRFIEVGERLQKKYGISVEVVPRKFGYGRQLVPVGSSHFVYNGDDLVYATKSPDYCLRDEKTGSLGTRGRSCNRTSSDYDSCEIMCCGRGHVTLTIQKVEMCKCKFHWCCTVACKKCLQWVDTHICN